MAPALFRTGSARYCWVDFLYDMKGAGRYHGEVSGNRDSRYGNGSGDLPGTGSGCNASSGYGG
ncbi:MAG: hypothetical protein VX633_09485, partial [Verrucomicrobiota bacterium]|nr:hypothetical protein [Verrucomicrobiota bacterium]